MSDLQIELGSKWRVKGSSAPETQWKVIGFLPDKAVIQCVKEDYRAFCGPKLGETSEVWLDWFSLKGILVT